MDTGKNGFSIKPDLKIKTLTTIIPAGSKRLP